MTSDGKRDHVTFEEAIGALDWSKDSTGEVVHTYVQSRLGGAFIGADWDREQVEAALRTYQPTLLGPGGRAMGHGIGVLRDGALLGFATVDERLDEIERTPEPSNATITPRPAP